MSYLLCFVSGVLCALPVLWDKLWPVSWAAFIPLFWVLIEKKPLYRHGLTWGFGYYGILYYWFTCLYPMDFVGFTPVQAIAVIATAWGGLMLLQSLGTALLAPLFRLVKPIKEKNEKYMYLYPLYLAAVWTLLEWLQGQTWLGVPFFRLAISQTACLPNIQNAALLGSLFTGFLIVLVNGYLTLGVIDLLNAKGKKDGMPVRKKSCIYAGNGALIFLFNFLGGTAALLLYRDSGEPVKVVLVQGNIGSADKWENSVYDSANLYISLTENACGVHSPDIVLWPETVINVTLRDNPYLLDKIRNTAKATQTIIMTGTFDRDAQGNSYNAIMIFYPDGTVGEKPYYKRHLVPFGEYLPMEKAIRTVFPLLAEMNVFTSPLTPGTGSQTMDTGYGKIGGLVCFDSIYEILTLQSVRDGAELIALATNDSWYYDTAAVYAHNRHAVLRAAESGRYVIRAANTGISSIIRGTGEITAYLPPLTRGIVSGEVYMRTGRTPYMVIGNLFVALCAVGYGITLGIRWAGKNQPAVD